MRIAYHGRVGRMLGNNNDEIFVTVRDSNTASSWTKKLTMNEAKHRGGELTSKVQAMASAVQVQCAIHESGSRKRAQVWSPCPPLPPLHKKGTWKAGNRRGSGWRLCRPPGTRTRLATVSKHSLVATKSLSKSYSYFLIPLTRRKEGDAVILEG